MLNIDLIIKLLSYKMRVMTNISHSIATLNSGIQKRVNFSYESKQNDSVRI